MTSNHLFSSTHSKPRPEYFLVRTTGEVVPLNTVDELPPGADIIGVPRSLILEETIGMLNLGLQRSDRGFYQFVTRVAEKDRQREDEEVDDEKRILGSKAPQGKPPPAPPSSPIGTPPPTPKPSIAHASPRSQSIQPSLSLSPAAEKLRRPKQDAAITDTTVSQICRHWCHHGICKWGRRCRHQHIMPMTLPGIQAVGLNDWPSWYRRLNPDYFASSTIVLNNGSESRSARVGRQAGGSRRDEINGVNRRALTKKGAGNARQRAVRGGGTGHRHIVTEKNEELGEQIIARLRGMSKDVRARGEGVKEKNRGVAERAVKGGTQDWEGSESGSDEDEERNEKKTKEEVLKVTDVERKLVDV